MSPPQPRGRRHVRVRGGVIRYSADSRRHRASAPIRAISERRSADIRSARTFPPRRRPSSEGSSSTSPVAIRATFTAHPITSPGRFSPLGPMGTCFPPATDCPMIPEGVGCYISNRDTTKRAAPGGHRGCARLWRRGLTCGLSVRVAVAVSARISRAIRALSGTARVASRRNSDVHHRNAVAGAGKPFEQRRADEPGPAGEQDVHPPGACPGGDPAGWRSPARAAPDRCLARPLRARRGPRSARPAHAAHSFRSSHGPIAAT